jgi:hypothetical protein
MKENKSRYLKIVKAKDEEDCYILFNVKQDTKIGFIEKRRVGRFMHWCLIIDEKIIGNNLFADNEEVYFTNGCLKEISTFITKLYGETNRKK